MKTWHRLVTYRVYSALLFLSLPFFTFAFAFAIDIDYMGIPSNELGVLGDFFLPFLPTSFYPFYPFSSSAQHHWGVLWFPGSRPSGIWHLASDIRHPASGMVFFVH